ncbi:MAG: AAA family ATPase, partial [Thermodesulfobacteriota bacterium]
MRPRAPDAPPGDVPALRLDPANECAWRGERRLELTPKEFAVLRHLVERAGRLVTKAELLDSVWDAVVSESALTSCIRDLRRALADSSRVPLYIETVHRRGFRFIGPVAAAAAPSRAPGAVRVEGVASAAPARPQLVGRDGELARLHASFADVAAGRRRVVLLSGEAGIGKTALVEEFLAGLDGEGEVRVGRGQCVEQFGAGEAYLPVLEALGRLGRGPRGDRVVATLRQYAPAWLAYLSGLLSDDELAAVERRAQATTRERTLRELAEALDALAADAPLVLLLEDLHWSDSATIDLLAVLARRRDPARVLVVGTYRPADVAASGHPLHAALQELRLHGHCVEVAVDFLGEEAIAELLLDRFPKSDLPARLARVLARSTSGNPLFLVNVVDDLVARGRVREVDGRWSVAAPVDELAATVPQTLRQMVETQIERLTPQEQAVLAVASVAGVEFSAELAASDGIAPRSAEECCDALARQGRFLRAVGAAEWPDGTVAARYAFIHALYQNVLYDRVPIGSRVGLHLRIGARLERAHGARAPEIAGELAMHFERGRDFERAIRWRRAAAEAALRRHAHREAAEHGKRALALLDALPESPALLQEELAIRMILGTALLGAGWAVPEVERTYVRARELCTRVADSPECFAILSGLFGFYISRAELKVARELAKQMLDIASAAGDAAALLAAHHDAGMVAFYAGELADAREHLEKALALYDPAQHTPDRMPAFRGGQDVGVTAALHLAWTLCLQGHPDQGSARILATLERARSLEHPYTLAFARHFIASYFQWRGDVERVREVAEVLIPGAAEEDIEITRALSAVCRGWLAFEDGIFAGVEEMRAGIAAYRSRGNEFGAPAFLALLAETYGRAGRAREGLAVVAEALAVAERSGAHF